MRGIAPRRSSEDRRLLVVADSGIYELSADSFRNIKSIPIGYPKDRGGLLPGGDAIAVGDMTGDGLDDVAVSSAGRVLIFQQKPELP